MELIKKKRYVGALEKPDESLFDFHDEDKKDDDEDEDDEDEDDECEMANLKKKTEIISIDSDTSSQSDDDEDDDDTDYGRKRKKNEVANNDSEIEVLGVNEFKRKRGSVSENNRDAAIVLSDDSDLSDAPEVDLDEVTNADPEIQTARAAFAMLKRSHEEVINRHKEMETVVAQSSRAVSPVQEAPEDFKFRESVKQEAERLLNAQSEAESDGEDGGNTIELKFRVEDLGKSARKQVVHSIKMLPEEKLGPVFEKFCTDHLSSHERSKVKFVLDGEGISNDESPQDLDLENGDMIDVKLS